MALLPLLASSAAAAAAANHSSSGSGYGGCDFDSFFEELCLQSIDSEWYGTAFSILLFLHAFVGIGVAVESRIVPAMETLCVRWDVREDVAGATFLAIGGGVPEITISAVQTIKSTVLGDDDDGVDIAVGAIMGQNIMALTLVPFIITMVAPSGRLRLKRRPLLRDFAFFACAHSLLCVAVSEGDVSVAMAGLLLGVYVAYVAVVVGSGRLREWWTGAAAEAPAEKVNFVIAAEMRKSEADATNRGTASPPESPLIDLPAGGVMAEAAAEDDEPTQRNPVVRCVVAAVSAWAWTWRVVIRCTVPDGSRGTRTEWAYGLSFALSLVWVSVCAFCVDGIADRWSHRLGVDAGFVGMLFVSTGAAVPDVIQNVIVARRGYGSMALAALMGAQVINLTVALGGVWLFASVAGGDVRVEASADMTIAGVFVACAWCCATVLFFGPVVALQQTKAQLDVRKAFVFLFCFVCIMGGYVIWSVAAGRA
eukprot:TRINITY_DN10555_c1_g1_i1.p1 TRINITY_DN10555_c1_g1~~TRINITY_DN10555_c1_g1_i1.p1  ORF type:complete len:512 (+),score=168.23 TRINITY_DN10555_c1_g1_i1:99-1538(+)